MRPTAAALPAADAPPWSAVALVTYANALGVLFGVVQAVVTARALGPAGLGVVGIVLAFGGVVANLFDIRLGDVSGRLLYDRATPGSPGGAAGIVRAGAALEVALAAVGLVATVGLVVAFLPRFTATPLAFSTVLALSAVPALATVANYLSYVQRFTDGVSTMALAQCLATTAGGALVVVVTLASPTVDSYALALLGGMALSLIIHAVALGRLFPAPAGARFSRGAVRALLAQRRLLFMTNALGYAKLLHRAADVLLVGFFCGEYQAGLYKCARSATDGLFVINDVLMKTYQPRLFRLAADRQMAAFRRLGRQVLVGVIGLAALALVAELVLLPILVPRLLGDVFTDAIPAMIVLTVPILCGFAVNVWAWPLLVTFTSLGFYTALSFAAVIAGQYVVAGIGHLLASGSALPFAVGHAAVFLLVYGSLVVFVRRQLPDFSPV